MSLSKITSNSLAAGAITGDSFNNFSIPTTKLANTTVVAGDYGNTNTAVSITISSIGVITRVANVSIGGVSGGGGGGGSTESGFNPFLLAGM